MELVFSAPVVWWRGPAPYHFVALPDDEAEQVAEVSAGVTYGWGMVPVTVDVGGTCWTTALWPKDGSFVVPLKVDVRRAEGIDLGDVVEVRLRIEV